MQPHHNPIFGNLKIPITGLDFGHASVMPDRVSLRQLIASNIAKLVSAHFGADAGKGIPQLAKRSGIARTTIGRIVTPTENDWGVSNLEHLAEALNMQPWELLLPDLELSANGAVRSLAAAQARQWPFIRISRADLESLNAKQMERLEATLVTRIAELREDGAPDAHARTRRRRA